VPGALGSSGSEGVEMKIFVVAAIAIAFGWTLGMATGIAIGTDQRLATKPAFRIFKDNEAFVCREERVQ
jgi:hypothetical protein